MTKLGQFYCLTEEEYEEVKEYEKLKKDHEDLLNLIARILPTEKETGDKEISREDFIKIHGYMVEQMFSTEDSENESIQAIYGHNVTVHWHGFYCDCLDGAQPDNYIFPAIKELNDEINS